MKTTKKILAALLAVACAFSTVGCSKDGNNSSYEPVIEVPDTEDISAIPDDADKNIVLLSYFDINPGAGTPEKRADLQLFEQKGGTIEYKRTTSLKKYDALAEQVLGGTAPDMFFYEQKMSFPCNVVQGMFQPIDSIVDFDSGLWADVKETSEQYAINGKHYVAPVDFGALSVITYDQNNIDNNGLDDPYQLYLEGKWDWDAMMSIMKEWSAAGSAENLNYGINGWFQPFIFHSTGKTLITYDDASKKYSSNLNDADLERAANYLYEIGKNNLYYPDWVGQASDAFQKNVLFYAMGSWASTGSHSPKEGDNWVVVPIPKDPNSDDYYVSLDVTAYMWVKGSTKSDAMKCWFECAKIVNTQEEYKALTKEKFKVENPNWSEEAYNMAFNEVVSNKFVRLNDPGYGISSDLSNDDAATNDSKEAIVAYMYSSVLKADVDSGAQFTWTQLRASYSNKIQSELDEFNNTFSNFMAKDS
ncbi:MAG: ABC transporter substrate-binding protein [Clostridiales bacterium]|nr:ABC transporter substrate-binding protein [Clostridiales bacterium]